MKVFIRKFHAVPVKRKNLDFDNVIDKPKNVCLCK